MREARADGPIARQRQRGRTGGSGVKGPRWMRCERPSPGYERTRATSFSVRNEAANFSALRWESHARSCAASTCLSRCSRTSLCRHGPSTHGYRVAPDAGVGAECCRCWLQLRHLPDRVGGDRCAPILLVTRLQVGRIQRVQEAFECRPRSGCIRTSCRAPATSERWAAWAKRRERASCCRVLLLALSHPGYRRTTSVHADRIRSSMCAVHRVS
jgi:hypothetical protein